MILEPFKQIDLAENNCQRKLENSWETLKMAKHILKDIHILKLNILGCDSTKVWSLYPQPPSASGTSI